MANFYLVCGISGGGKTVLSKRILSNHPNIIFYDVDDYYKKINGDECIHQKSFDVWHLLFKDIHDSMLRNEDVLLTTNALTVAQRRQLIEWFPQFTHHLIWVISPLDRCLKGNKQRRRQMPEGLLLRDWSRMEFPNPSEAGWMTITHVTNCWDNENYIIFNLKDNILNYLKKI
jgi:predicted kinase